MGRVLGSGLAAASCRATMRRKRDGDARMTTEEPARAMGNVASDKASAAAPPVVAGVPGRGP